VGPSKLDVEEAVHETRCGEVPVSVTAQSTPEERARKRAKERTDVMWHVAAFVVINILLWVIDIGQGGGIDWAFWPTIGWGVGLAFHVASYVIDVSGMEERSYQKFLVEERSKESSDHA
jgi:hypothetical protein